MSAMDERRYRESHLCRLLGNPVVVELVVLLDTGTPTIRKEPRPFAFTQGEFTSELD